jgi:hypothetical protein
MPLRGLRRFDRTDLILALHFFRGFFESDLLSVRDRLATVFTGIVALIASFGLVLPILFTHKYAVLNTLPTPTLYGEAALADRLMFICLSTDLTAFVTVLNWQSLFPELRDFLILGPLPLERLQLFRAKLIALLVFVTLLILSINVLPPLFLTAVMNGPWQLPHNMFLQIGSFFIASCLAGYFAFFFLLGIQGLLLNLLPPRWSRPLSVAMQTVLLIAICAALPLISWIPGLHSIIAARLPGISWLPPVWFVGLCESMLGNPHRVMHSLAARAVWFLGLAMASSLLLYLATYTRSSNLVLQDPVMRQGLLAKCLSQILNAVTRIPQEAAILSFTVRSIVRSRLHKLLVAGIVGFCFALVLDGFLSALIEQTLGHHLRVPESSLLSAICSAPLIVAYFLLNGLLFVFSIPIEPRANWIFRLSDIHGSYRALNASEKVLLLVVVAPVSAMTGLLLAGWTGLELASLETVFVLLMSLILLQTLLWNWDRIPFTCPYLPGRRNLIQSALLFVTALSGFGYTAARIGLRLSASVPAMMILLAALLAIFLSMRVQRRKTWTGSIRLRFDDEPDPEVQRLDLERE